MFSSALMHRRESLSEMLTVALAVGLSLSDVVPG
jgi:hypothetical protein